MLTLPFYAVYGSAVCMAAEWLAPLVKAALLFGLLISSCLSLQYLMDVCVVIVVLSCRMPTLF